MIRAWESDVCFCGIDGEGLVNGGGMMSGDGDDGCGIRMAQQEWREEVEGTDEPQLLCLLFNNASDSSMEE